METRAHTVVLDASVVLKWYLRDEGYTAQADALLQDWQIHGSTRATAPHLLVYEVINGIVTAVRQRRLSLDQGARALDKLVSVGIELRGVPPQRVFALAIEHRLAAYDAAYLALAQAEGCELWTGDKPFYDSIKGSSPLVRWIGEYTAAAR